MRRGLHACEIGVLIQDVATEISPPKDFEFQCRRDGGWHLWITVSGVRNNQRNSPHLDVNLMLKCLFPLSPFFFPKNWNEENIKSREVN